MARTSGKSRFLFYSALVLLGFSAVVLFRMLSRNAEQTQAKVVTRYEAVCGSCHLTPDPSRLPKSIWRESVLPQMWNIAGAPKLDSLERAALTEYILANAPDSLPRLQGYSEATPLHQFTANPVTLDNNASHGLVTGINSDTLSGELWIGDALGRSYSMAATPAQAIRYESPVVSTINKAADTYLTLIGNLGPSDAARGKLLRVSGGETTTLSDSLRRPVYTHVEDLNNDGIEEILICEFGNTTGALTLLTPQRSELISLPGSIKVEVVDMDGDGRKDIIALFGQAREGIRILYQRENMRFEEEVVLEFPPEFGSSWFELVDLNADGHRDLVLANGDNADYSIVLKPYHGVRVFLNDGTNHFDEEYFFPMYGATRVIARDFDQDGDMDLGALAFFPDFERYPEFGFAYLENLGEGVSQFRPQLTSLAAKGNWLVMEAGDVDTDGDLDLILGNFYQFRSREYRKANPVDLLLLENILK